MRILEDFFFLLSHKGTANKLKKIKYLLYNPVDTNVAKQFKLENMIKRPIAIGIDYIHVKIICIFKDKFRFL